MLVSVVIIFLIGPASRATPAPEARAIYDFLVDETVRYREFLSWDAAFSAVSPARQAEIAGDLQAMLTPDYTWNRVAILRLSLERRVLERVGELSTQFAADAARFTSAYAPDSLAARSVADAIAVSDLGLPSLAWVLRPENLDDRRRWALRVDQILRREREDPRARLSRADLLRWRDRWRATLTSRLDHLVREALGAAIRWGMFDDLAEMPHLVQLDGAAADPLLLTADVLTSGRLCYGEVATGDWGWTLFLPNGRHYAIRSGRGLTFNLRAGVFDAVGRITRGSLLNFLSRLIWEDGAQEIQALNRILNEMPERPTRAELSQYVDDRLATVRAERLTWRGVAAKMVNVENLQPGEARLYDLIAGLRMLRVFREGQENAWDLRNLTAEIEDKPFFTLQHLVGPASPSRPPVDDEHSRMSSERNIYDLQSAYEVRGEIEDDAFLLHRLTRENEGEWRETTKAATRPRGIQLRSLEDVQVNYGFAMVPTPLHYEVSTLEVLTGERSLVAERDYRVIRHPRTGAYGLRFTDGAIDHVALRVTFAPVTGRGQRNVPLVPGATRRLRQALRSFGERPLTDALAGRPKLTARALVKLIETLTLYSFWPELNSAAAAGPLADFAPFLDDHGTLCVQCEQAAHLLKRLLDLGLPREFSTRVETVLLRDGARLVRPTHAVVDVYRGAELWMRLNPAIQRHDPRAPTASSARELVRTVDRRQSASALADQQTSLLATYPALARLPAEAPLLRLYRLATRVRQAAESGGLEHDVTAQITATFADWPRWVAAGVGARPVDRWIAPLHAASEAAARTLAERVRAVTGAESCTAALGDVSTHDPAQYASD